MPQLRITDVNKRVDEHQEDIRQLVEHGESVVLHLNQQKSEIELTKLSLKRLNVDFNNFKKIVYGGTAVLVVAIAACLGLGVL